MNRSHQGSEDGVKNRAVVEEFAQRLELKHKRLRFLTERGPVAGTVWSTYPDDANELFGPLVVILEEATGTNESFRVAEVTQDVCHDSSGAVMLRPEHSGLNFSCFVLLDQLFILARDKLRSCAGELEVSVSKTLLSILKHKELSREADSIRDVDKKTTVNRPGLETTCTDHHGALADSAS